MFKKRNIVLKLEAMKQNNIKKIQSVMPLKLRYVLPHSLGLQVVALTMV